MIQDFCLHALAMEMITRVGNQPKYGYPPLGGIIRGWSEHDSSLRVNPYGLIQPFFSNGADACRGFLDIGRVFQAIGRSTADKALAAEGVRLVREAGEIKQDLFTGIRKTMRTNVTPPYLPPVAGDKMNM